MKRILLIIAVLAAVSCVKRDDVKLNRFVTLRAIDLTSAELVVNITNNSRHTLTLSSFKLNFEDEGRRFAEVVMSAPVDLAPRTSGDVVIGLRMRLTNPLSAMVSLRNLSMGSATVTLSGQGVAKIGPLSKKVDIAPTPVVEYLKQAGIDPAQMVKSLGL